MERPPATEGMHHIALRVRNLAACEHFYVDLMGMNVEWRPDSDNLYLTSGSDNLALHRVMDEPAPQAAQRMDHFGFIITTAQDVDRWHEFLLANETKVVKPPRTHRDGARSFYCLDPDGNTVQFIYHPPLAD